MHPLAQENCVPCQGGIPPLQGDELTKQLRQLGGDWKLVDEHHLEKTFTFPDFASALTFTNKIGAIAEQQSHHPVILLAWGRVTITLWTHKINGLHRNDFILAARINEV